MMAMMSMFHILASPFLCFKEILLEGTRPIADINSTIAMCVPKVYGLV
jgi:hypothetical protein